MGASLACLPCAQLSVQVVTRQAQQAGHVGGNARHGGAVALDAGGDLSVGVTCQHQLLAFCQQRGILPGRCGGGVGHVKVGKILRYLHQVSIAQRRNQLRHQPIVPPPFTKVQQLVVQVAGRLARQARVVAIRCRAALRAMAAGTGQRALGHGVFKRRGLRRRCEGNKKDGRKPAMGGGVRQSYGHKRVDQQVCQLV